MINRLNASREAVSKARHVLKQAEGRFDHDKGLDDAVTARLMSNIRKAEDALADANAVVTQADGEHWGPKRRYT